MPDDYVATTQTTGTVSVGGTATGEVERGRDRDWFAVELEAGRTYTDRPERGSETADGTLRDPYLRGIHDSARATFCPAPPTMTAAWAATAG